MSPLRILLLSPWMPWPPHDGGRIRVLNTLRHLSRRHRVTLAAPSRTPRDAEAASELRGLCEEVVTAEMRGHASAVAIRALRGMLRRRPLIEGVHYDPLLAEKVRYVTTHREFDIVQVEFSWFTPYLSWVRPGSAARTVLTLHNVESLRFARELQATTTLGRRLALGWDQRFASTWEPRAVGRVDGVVVVSEAERRWVDEVAPGKPVVVAPNGVDTRQFRPSAYPEQGPLVFTGAMDYPPNIDGVLWFCREVWPTLRRRTPGLRLEVVGRAPHPSVRALNGEAGIRVTGEVRDVRLLLAQASVVVVPLRAGAGTRLKILEAMAMARPVVSTTLGAEGLDVVPGSNILLADTPTDLVNAVESLLDSSDVASRMGEAGRRLVEERYDWERCFSPLEALYERLLTPATTMSGAR